MDIESQTISSFVEYVYRMVDSPGYRKIILRIKSSKIIDDSLANKLTTNYWNFTSSEIMKGDIRQILPQVLAQFLGKFIIEYVSEGMVADQAYEVFANDEGQLMVK